MCVSIPLRCFISSKCIFIYTYMNPREIELQFTHKLTLTKMKVWGRGVYVRTQTGNCVCQRACIQREREDEVISSNQSVCHYIARRSCASSSAVSNRWPLCCRDEKEDKAEGFCQTYRGSTCSKFVGNMSIYVQSKFTQGMNEEKFIGMRCVTSFIFPTSPCCFFTLNFWTLGNPQR